jgi:hypothetical protein
MSKRHSLSIAALAILWFADQSALGEEQKPVVSLLLTKASAERRNRDILFNCDAVLDNSSGKKLIAHTSFFSVFDGLELVVTMPDGKILAQQAYVMHQSPYSPGREIRLKKGRNEDSMVFPISGLPADAKTLKVRLVGTLPGSEYKRVLLSETLEIKVK